MNPEQELMCWFLEILSVEQARYQNNIIATQALENLQKKVEKRQAAIQDRQLQENS
ncbi:MAG: hypothetical protein ACREHG_00240 [Candidatus Saccharimonadales bacterium]